MRKMFPVVVILLLAVIAYAHHPEETTTFYFMDAFLYGLAALIVLSLIAVYFAKGMKKWEKNAAFILFVSITIVVTVYLAAATVYLNLTSVTGGPVHWHADFEVWACGQKLNIVESEGFENKVGTEVLHHHNDLRIHVEGVLQHMDEASVGEFFRSIGGEFTEDTLTVPLADKTVRTWRNGDLCPDGLPGKIRFFVNGQPNKDFGKYVIAPYPDVPPGDFLNITFSTR